MPGRTGTADFVRGSFPVTGDPSYYSPMLDIRWIIDNKDLVKEGARRKRIDVDVDRLCGLYDQRKAVQQQIEGIAAEKNKTGKTLPKLPPDQKQAVLVRMKELTGQEEGLKKQVGELDPQ